MLGTAPLQSGDDVRSLLSSRTALTDGHPAAGRLEAGPRRLCGDAATECSKASGALATEVDAERSGAGFSGRAFRHLCYVASRSEEGNLVPDRIADPSRRAQRQRTMWLSAIHTFDR